MWSQVTLKQFSELSYIEPLDIPPVEKAIKRLKVLGIEPDTSSLGNLLNQIPTFLNTLPSEDIKLTYTIEGEEYHPHLNFVNMETARFLDLYHQIQGKDPKDANEWAYVFSLILSKHGEPYDYESHIARAEKFFNKMTFDQCYPLVCFFLNVWNHLSMIAMDSSMEKLRTQIQDLIKTYNESTSSSQKIGVGSHT